MNLKLVLNEVSAIWIFESCVLLKDSEKIINTNSNNVHYLEKLSVKNYQSSEYYCEIFEKKICIYISSFDKVKDIEYTNCYSIKFFYEESDFLIYWQDEEKISYITYYKNNIKIESGRLGFGIILNQFYRLHYNQNVYAMPSYFRCSDLFDTKTYWEYSCDEGEIIRGKYIIYDTKLIFRVEKELDLYESEFFIVILDIATGKHISKIKTLFVEANFDETTGKFVAIQGSNANHQIIKHYEIIDVNLYVVARGDLNYQGELHRVGIAVDFLADNTKLYFVDNVYDYNDQTFTTPKVGCFDVQTKNIDFIEEIPEAVGLRLDQIVYKDNKIYVRSSDNKLFIYEV